VGSRAAERLFLSDAEIAERIPQSLDEWVAAAAVLERHGLPKRDPLFQERRCWPMVRDFLCARAGGSMEQAPRKPAGATLQGEVVNAFGSPARRRTGT
jgi:hypothetical protein